MNLYKKGKKFWAIIAFMFFFCHQVSWAVPEVLDLTNREAPVVTGQKSMDLSQARTEPNDPAGTAMDFLQQENPLNPVSDETLIRSVGQMKTAVQNYEYERYSIDEAMDLFRPEYASAVVVENVSGEDLARLQKLSFETALIVLSGEIILFTTGNEAEIGSSQPAAELLRKAVFVSHVHSQGTEQEGPSTFDLLEAVSAPGVEYVVTGEGAYVYNSRGIQNGGEKLSLSEMAKLIEAARATVRISSGEDQTAARSELNQFIREMDLYNTALMENRETFRRSLVPVNTLAELQAIKNNLTGDYYLTSDIDASGTVNWNGGFGFEPIGTGNDPFRGSFNGNGFKITNLTINRPAQDYVGLFGSLESAGTIENVKLENVSVFGRNNVGAVSGYAFMSELSNAAVDGGSVTGVDRVGGLVGESYNGHGINNSHSNVAVSGNHQVGGLVGKLWDGILNNINQSYVLGMVSGGNEVGGLAGYSKSGDMIRSYVTGNVAGKDYVGGLVGYTTENAGIRDSYYSGGSVSGITNNVGGIAGLYGSYDDGIGNTYFSGTVTSAGAEGGFLGTYQAGTLAGNFWDTTLNAGLQDTSMGDLAGITGQSTAAMQTQNNFTDWNFDNIWVMSGYPHLQQAVAVSTLKELQDMRVNLNAKYYLVNDIDASATASWNSGLGFNPIGTGNGDVRGVFNANAFHGAFNGAGYKITGLTINRPAQDYVGLFGSIESAGAIENIKLENVSITGRNNVGGLTGYMFAATVTGSSVSGELLAGVERVGGLAGESYNGNGIKESFTNILVSGQNQVGGIVGKLWDGNLNDLTQTYSLGRVSGTNQIGGLVGYSKSGDMIRSYATGSIDGQDYVGGLVGFTTENAGIRDSYYAVGHISGTTNRVGGIAGLYGSYDDGIQRTYFAGQVTSTAGPGGFIGNYTAGALADNFWDSTLNPGFQDSVSPGNLNGVTAQTTALMQTQNTFTNWDFTTIWHMDGYPKLGSAPQDVTVPTGTAVINESNAHTNSPDLSVRVVSSEPIQFYNYRVDGGAWSAQLSFPNVNGSHGAGVSGEDLAISVSSQEGQRLIEIQLYDFAGNISSIISDTIILDTTAPFGAIQQITVGDRSLGQAYNKARIQLSGIMDLVSGIQQIRYRIGGGAWDDLPLPLGQTLTADVTLPEFWGTKSLEIQIIDRASNIRNFSQNITIAVEEYIKDVEMRYLSPSTVDAPSGYPQEGYYQQGYTQPSHIGFYAQLLANIIAGEIVTDKLTAADARVKLQTVINSLRVDQLTLGKFGLLPWMKFNGASRLPANGAYGQQVVFIDNSNLAASLAAASGALRPLAAQADINQIITDIESFLDRQAEGYQKLYDSSRGLFRSGCFITAGTSCSPIGGYQDVLGNEARGGVEFVMLRYNFSDSVFRNALIHFKPYVKADGLGLDVLAPYNGSAFQMLWPLLVMPETLNAGLNDMLKDFTEIALDHSERNGLPGLASAGWEVCAAGDPNIDCASRGTKYNGNLGIGSLAVGAGTYNDRVGSLYMLGAAYMIDPVRVKARLEAIMTQYEGGLITNHGLWEGYDQEQQRIVQEQVGANIFTFILGLIGKGPEHMTEYLKWKDASAPPGNSGYYSRLKTFYTNNAMSILNQSTGLCFEANHVGFAGCPTSWSKPYNVNVPNFSYFTVYFQRNSPAVFEVGGEKLTLKYTSNIDLSNVTIEFKTGPGSPAITIPNVKLKATAPAVPGTPKEIKEISFGLPQNVIFNNIHEITIKAVGGAGNQALAFSIEAFDLSGSSVPSPRPGEAPLEVPTAFIEINNGDAFTTSRQVTLKLDASKNAELMRISLDGGVTWMEWESVQEEFSLTLPDGAGFKEVKVQVKDSFGQYSDLFSDKILYDIPGFLSQAEVEPSVVPVVRQVLKQMLLAVRARISDLNSRIKKAKTNAARKLLEKQIADWLKIQNQINQLDQDLMDQETLIAKTGTIRMAILSRVLTETILIFGLLY